MKTELLECITPGQLRKEVGALIAKEGTQGKAAAKIGIPQSTLSQFMSGYNRVMGRKILAFFGLERRDVYIRKTAQESVHE